MDRGLKNYRKIKNICIEIDIVTGFVLICLFMNVKKSFGEVMEMEKDSDENVIEISEKIKRK